MNYKIKGILKKSRPVFIVVIILWVISLIVFVPPFVVAVVNATNNGVFNFNTFIGKLIENAGSVGDSLSKAFSANYIGTYIKAQFYVTLVLLFAAIVGMIKSAPKNEYTDIEHGSSDWSERGEEYSVLSKKDGILLAENHYLPVDKRGNVNVMVVGRFWLTVSQHHMLYQMRISFWGRMYLQTLKGSCMTRQQDI